MQINPHPFCTTYFTIPYSDKNVSHPEMPCQQALKILEEMKNQSPYSYLSDVKLTKQHSFFPAQDDRYKVLSLAQFKTLVECAERKQNPFTYYQCRQNCYQTRVENVDLNPIDEKRFFTFLATKPPF